LFSIDRKIYLALEGGPSRFDQDFSCPDLLDKWSIRIDQLANIRLAKLGVPDCHRLWRTIPGPSARIANFLPYADHWQNLLAKRIALLKAICLVCLPGRNTLLTFACQLIYLKDRS
jgi:hypothetical protein